MEELDAPFYQNQFDFVVPPFEGRTSRMPSRTDRRSFESHASVMQHDGFFGRRIEPEFDY